MNKRLKKKREKRPRGYMIISSPINNTPIWKRYKTRIKLSKRYTVELRSAYTGLIHWMKGLSIFNKEEEIDE